MEIKQIDARGGWDNLNYVVIGKGGECLVIDPLDIDQIDKVIREYRVKVKAVINTHGHLDHIQGNLEASQKFDAPIWAHPLAKQWGTKVDHYLQDREMIDLAGEADGVEVLHTPGHTMDHLSLLVTRGPDSWALICGDTLFNAGVGNCHNGGDPAGLYDTIQKIVVPLDDKVEVLPGHNYLVSNLSFTLSLEPGNMAAQQLLEQGDDQLVSNIGLERKINLFLRQAPLKFPDGEQLDGQELFLRLREQRNRW